MTPSGQTYLETAQDALHRVGVMPTRDVAAISELWRACEALTSLVQVQAAQIADLEKGLRAAFDGIGP